MRKKANNRSFVLASLLVAALLFSGCTKKEQPTPPPPPPPKPAAKAPLPVQKQSTSAKTAGIAVQPLDFSAKKDPFKPFATEPAPQAKAKPAAMASTEDLLPIQLYDVNKFKVSGVIVGLKENTALVIDPEGRGYVVRVGMLIGNSDGRISRITPSSIEVVEHYRDDNGHSRKRTIMQLYLRKSKETPHENESCQNSFQFSNPDLLDYCLYGLCPT